MDKSQILNIAENFCFEGDFVDFKENRSGNINMTFILTYKSDKEIRKYTLQKLNTYVFKNPTLVMDNILKVTEHLKNKLKSKYADDYKRRTLCVVKTKDDLPYLYSVELGFWRSFTYIDDAKAYDMVQKPEDFYQAGKAFGEFQSLLADFPVETLNDTIPDFHNTPKRLEVFTRAVDEDKAKRKDFVKKEIDFILSHKDRANKIINMVNDNSIPLRVTHNDTKFNNVLIDDKTGEGICVIDLDTVMPGTALYDFGDAVRYGASTASEDEKDLSKVNFDLLLFEQFAKGFIESTKGHISDDELRLLPLGAMTITIELASRFLSDYLDGDLYFKINYKEHNLDRAKTQIKLADDIERKMPKMSEIIEKYIK